MTWDIITESRNRAPSFWKLEVLGISEGQLWLTALINYAWWLLLICQAAFQVGEGTDEREEKVRRRRRGRRQERRRGKLKPCGLIKTGVNFFSVHHGNRRIPRGKWAEGWKYTRKYQHCHKLRVTDFSSSASLKQKDFSNSNVPSLTQMKRSIAVSSHVFQKLPPAAANLFQLADIQNPTSLLWMFYHKNQPSIWRTKTAKIQNKERNQFKTEITFYKLIHKLID